MNKEFGFQWHITDRCAGGCRHCYQTAFDGASELPVGALTRIADCVMTALADTQVSVNVTGGEPLLYQCINKNYGARVDGRINGGAFELMAHLSKFDNIDELNIITGTYGLNQSVINNLKSIPRLTSVKVSLESHDPRINDGIRNHGHFNMVTRNIKALADSGLPVVVMATLSRHNYESVEGLCGLCADMGAAGVILERYVPLGRGTALADNVLTSREWRDIAAAVIRVANIDVSIDDLLPYRAFRIDMPHGTLGDDCEVSGAFCNLGPSSMALMPDGTVYPCRRVPTAIGKLPDDGMEAILSRLDEHSSTPQQCFRFDF
ncbi:MAG: radical SAM protein [Chitinispirillales bacterium]|nr:radical SAM protein [Chitinispirillales bacterium]